MFTDEQIADHPFPDLLNRQQRSGGEGRDRECRQERSRLRRRPACPPPDRRVDGQPAARLSKQPRRYRRRISRRAPAIGCAAIPTPPPLPRHGTRPPKYNGLIATGRLSAIAFERAIVGTPREIWRGGKLIAEMSVPSDKMMMFLLQHLLPRTYGQHGPGNGSVEARIADARTSLPATLGTLADIDDESPEALTCDDYLPQPPREEGA